MGVWLRRSSRNKNKIDNARSQCSANYGRNLAEADQMLLDSQYKQAENAYRALIDSDETGDAMAGLAVAIGQASRLLIKILQAEKVLKQARDRFADNPNVLAAGGYVSYVHAKTVASPARRDLYLEAADSLCSKAVTR